MRTGTHRRPDNVSQSAGKALFFLSEKRVSCLLDVCWTRNNKMYLLRTDTTDRKDLTDAYL